MADICVVDDETGIAEMCKDYLAGEHKVRVFTSPAEALAAFDKDYHPDLVMSDIKMPGMDGFTMVRRLHEHHKDIPVVMMSAYADKKHLIESIEVEAQGFLEKPFNLKRMKEVVQTALNKTVSVRSMENLICSYEQFARVARQLMSSYIERYVAAENSQIEDPLTQLDRVKEENRLDRELSQILASIEKQYAQDPQLQALRKHG